jgi:hypothetical protein
MLELNLVAQDAHDLHVMASETPDYGHAITDFQTQSLIAGLQEILVDAARVASTQKEFSMPLAPYEILGFLRYSRQPEGRPVLPAHALNAVTREFFDQLYAKHYGLTQFYVGEERAIFTPTGPQRLRLHW